MNPQPQQFDELAYTLEINGEYERLVKELSTLNGTLSPQERNQHYNACLTWATSFNAYQVTEVARLLKEKLGIPTAFFFKDLRKAERETIKEGQDKGELPKGKEYLTADFPGLVDIIEVEGKPAFLMVKDGELCWNETTEVEGQKYLPPPREHLPWLLPSGYEVLKHYQELKVQGETWVHALCSEVFDLLHSTSEMPSEDYYQELLIPWVLHTYLLEHFHYSPILCLYAVPERGKSRTGKALAYHSYRGVVVETLRESNIIRLATDCKATIFFDTMGLWRKVERNQSEDVILARYERGSVVPRVLYPERGPFKDTRNYKVFGPTIIATNENIHHILETRAIVINMPEASRRFENNITPEIALPLREKLVAFRAYYLDKPLPQAPKPAQGRLGDILQPLYQVVRLVRGQEGDPSFLGFVAKLEEDRRMERSDTLEAQVVRAILALENKVERGILPVQLITDTLNRTRPQGKELTPEKIGRLLNSLGLDKGRTNDGHKAITWDARKISLLQARYGLKKPSVPSEPSVPAQFKANGTDRTEGTEGSEGCLRCTNPENKKILEEAS